MLTSAAFQKTVHSASNKGISSVRARLPELIGQSPAEFLSNCNLLGYDNGDGEISCSLARYDGENLIAQPLSFSKTSMVSHIPNIIAFDEHGRAITVNEAQLGTSKKIYYNFKRCPGEAASAVYPYENENKTYEDLMAHSFACSIQKLVECNTVFDPAKPTVIMVGRPSSKGWEAAEQAYIEILSRYLSLYLPEYAENITVLVLSESLAAMAGALEMKPEHWKDIFAQILDLGSSTFDKTTVTPYGIPDNGEDSFQFGGNQLDHAIAAYADALFYKKYPREAGYSMAPDHTKIASMRFKKELCYGDNGKNLETQQGQNAYTFSVYQNGEPVIDEATEDEETYGFRITKKSLEKILTNESGLEELNCTTVRLSDDGTDEEITHSGWLQACEYVLQQFYDKTKDLLPENKNVKKHLILTGGVSNMPEVRALAEKIFHADKAIVADNPSQTVSRGLALILGNELLKKSALEEICESLMASDSVLPNASLLLEKLADAAANSDLKYYENVIESWANSSTDRTLGDLVASISDSDNGIFDPQDNFVEEAIKNWFERYKIDEKIEKMLHERLSSMFPTFTKKYKSTTLIPDLSGIPQKTLENNFKLNIYMFFNKDNCPEDPYDLDRLYSYDQRQEILDVFRKHRNALSEGGSFSCGTDHQIEFTGIKDMYLKQFNLQDDVIPLQKLIIEMLMPQINDFVESVTYYLAASTHK